MRPGFVMMIGGREIASSCARGSLAAELSSAANEPRYFLVAVFFRADLAAAGFAAAVFAAVFAAGFAGAAVFAAGTAFFAVLLRPRAGLRASADAVADAAAGVAAGVSLGAAADVAVAGVLGVDRDSAGMS